MGGLYLTVPVEGNTRVTANDRLERPGIVWYWLRSLVSADQWAHPVFVDARLVLERFFFIFFSPAGDRNDCFFAGTDEGNEPQVLIAGAASSPVVGQMLDAVLHHRNWLLGQVVIRIDPLDERETAGFLGQRRPALRQLKAPAAYLCRHRSCSAPVATADDLCGLLAHRT